MNDVNKWVSEKTNGVIKEAADDSMKDMLACLMNAIAFEAKWGRPYEAIVIFEDEFHNADGTTCEVDMGIRTPFTPEADFSPLSSAQLMVDAIIHKAHIEADSQGTKAAAITEEFAVAGCCPNFDLKEVYLDRPFVYAIMHAGTRLPVFVGVLNNVT